MPLGICVDKRTDPLVIHFITNLSAPDFEASPAQTCMYGTYRLRHKIHQILLIIAHFYPNFRIDTSHLPILDEDPVIWDNKCTYMYFFVGYLFTVSTLGTCTVTLPC